MWAIGVITYCLLVGYPPFNAESDAKLFRKIQLTDYEFIPEDWKGISEDAKRFIMALLEPNTKRRMKPDEALKHIWIVKNASKQMQMVDIEILETLRMCKR
jgi:serine/threonine protein kinase